MTTRQSPVRSARVPPPAAGEIYTTAELMEIAKLLKKGDKITYEARERVPDEEEPLPWEEVTGTVDWEWNESSETMHADGFAYLEIPGLEDTLAFPQDGEDEAEDLEYRNVRIMHNRLFKTQKTRPSSRSVSERTPTETTVTTDAEKALRADVAKTACDPGTWEELFHGADTTKSALNLVQAKTFVESRYGKLNPGPDAKRCIKAMISSVQSSMQLAAKNIHICGEEDWLTSVKTLLIIMDYFHRHALGQSKVVLDEMTRIHYEEDEPKWITTVQDKAIVHTKALNAVTTSLLYGGRKTEEGTEASRNRGGRGRVRGGGGRANRGRGHADDDKKGVFRNALEAAKDMKLSELPPELRKALNLPKDF